MECASIQDVLAATDGIDEKTHYAGKRRLKRIVSMLTKLIARTDSVAEESRDYHPGGSSTSTSTASLSTSTIRALSQNQALNPSGLT